MYMRLGQAAVLLVLALSGPLSGCIERDERVAPTSVPAVPQVPDVPLDPITVLTDPEGDARTSGSYEAAEAIPCVSSPGVGGVGIPPGVDCMLGKTPIYVLGPASPFPAPPARDLVGVRFAESPSTFTAMLDVASLDEELSGLYDMETGEGTVFILGLASGEDRCGVALLAFLWPGIDHVDPIGFLWVDCSHLVEGPEPPKQSPCGFRYCAWEAPLSFLPATPGTIELKVTRTELSAVGVGEKIEGLFVIPLVIPPRMAEDRREITVRGPLELMGYRADARWYAADFAGGGDPFPFTTAATDIPAPTGPYVLRDRSLDPRPRYTRPDLHILETRLIESGDSLTVAVDMEAVDQEPKDPVMGFELVVGGAALWFGYDATGGTLTPYANLAFPDLSSVSLPVRFTAVPGTPGRVEFAFQRSDIPSVAPGALIGAFLGWTQLVGYNETSVGTVSASGTYWIVADWIGFGPRHAFSTPASDVRDALRIPDAQGDVVPHPALTLSSRRRFDLLGIEPASDEPGKVRITLGIADVSSLDPPPGYDDVFFAVGLEGPSGPVMVGYYRGEDRPMGEFLCAPDTTVLAEEPGDPVHSPQWTEITGRVLVASSSGTLNQNGGSNVGTAAFIMTAPLDCFGLPATAEALNVTRISAGAYIIRRTGSAAQPSSVDPLDTVEADRGFVLAIAKPVVPIVPWYRDGDFWNVLGTLLALFTILVTVILFFRRRSLMKWYLDELGRLDRLYVGDPTTRAKNLVALRKRLHRDIVRHRVSDAQYILDRMRASITSARLVTISDGYYDLPAPLALRIERLLDDGRLTAEEASLIEPLVGRSTMPPETKSRLVERLRAWVEEDASWA
ncbi:MAG: hypothetical protein ACT4PT_00620 [Methanobacteriota archaeon]